MPNQARSLSKPAHNAETGLAPSLAQQHLWFRLTATRRWSTLGLVPAEADLDLGDFAENMGRLAADQPDARVLVVNASLRGCLPRSQPSSVDIVMDGITTQRRLTANCDVVDFQSLHLEDAERALGFAPQLLDYMASEGKTYSVAIFAVDSLLAQTRAIPLIRTLDRVALCLSLGRTTFAQARQLIEIVGRDKVAGAIAVSR